MATTSLRKWHVALGRSFNFGTVDVSGVRTHGAHHPALTYHNANIENISIEGVTKSLSCSEFYILKIYFRPIGYLRKLQQWNSVHNRSWIYEYLFISTLIVFHGFFISWSMANSLNLIQKRIWDLCNIYDGALVKIIVDSWNPLTIITTSSTLDAAGILSPAFSYGVMVAK